MAENRKSKMWRRAAVVLLAWGAALAGSPSLHAAPPNSYKSKAQHPSSKQADKRPTWKQVEETVRTELAKQTGYRSGDIISRQQVDQIMSQLARLGWRVPQQDQILARIPQDSSWLVRTLRTDKGRRFARQIATMPQGYDRVDRMTALSDGRRIITDLIAGPGGAELIQSFTTSKTGKGTAKQLTSVPGGANFDKPTGMIYTGDALLQELLRLYSGNTPTATGSPRR